MQVNAGVNLNGMDANVQQRRTFAGGANAADQYDSAESRQQQQPSSANLPGGVFTQSIASSVGSYVFTTGKARAQQALNIYSHIDYLRPYFDVEPRDVLNRLLHSVAPLHAQSNTTLTTELYGPLMILFTLCAIIIYQMKMASHNIQDGTLIGTAFFVCFSYWLGASFLISSASFVCNSSISLFNYLSLFGYSMFSHCVVLFVGTFLHTAHDHFIFYALWLLLSGAAGLKLAYIIYSHTSHPRHRLSVAALALLVHMLFLLYVHFAYHELAEEVSHALFDSVTDRAVRLDATTASSAAAAVADASQTRSSAAYQRAIHKRFNKPTMDALDLPKLNSNLSIAFTVDNATRLS